MSAAPERLSELEREWLREEFKISRQFARKTPWGMVAWGLGNVLLWASLWPLVFFGGLPLWAGFVLSTVCITISYLPSHEAQHSNIGPEGTKLRWLNELVGHVSIWPLVLPYRIARITHRAHHAHTNDPELDPDHYNRADTWWQAVWAGIQGGQPGAPSAYKALAQQRDDPETRRAVREALALQLAYYAILTGLAWSGFAIEACLLWWLPRHIATSYISLFLSWAPHHPMLEQGRYRDTRAWRSPIGTVLSLWMEYHVVHHLFPNIPLIQTKAAWEEMGDLLLARGVRSDGL